MELPSILSYLALPLLLVVLTKLLFSSSKNNAKNPPPSPPSRPIIGHLHLISGSLHRALDGLTTRYGPVLRLRFGNRPVLIVASPAVARECFTKNDLALANRPQLPSWRHLSVDYKAIGAANYGPHWRNMRRISTVEVLSAQRLSSFYEARAEEVRTLAKGLLRDHLAGKATAELRARLFELVLNVMMTMLAAKRYYGGEDSMGTEEARRFHEIIAVTFALSGTSGLSDFLPFLRYVDFSGTKKKWERLAKERDEFLQGLIDEKRKEMANIGVRGEKEETKRKSMISVLLELQRAEPENYSDDVIKALVITLISAGTDTSSNSMEWGLALLLNHPEKMDKARAEIDAVIGTKRLIQESDLPTLPYLQNVVSETLRLYPAAPLLIPHESSTDCVVGGYDVAPGTMVLVNMYSIHRDANTWSDPNSFVPERFESQKGEAHMMAPFGMGRRQCPGEGLANRTVGLVIGVLIQCFEWERMGKGLVDMSEGSGLTVPRAVPLEAKFRPRQEMMDVLSAL